MDLQLSDKVVFVTGASGGIGRALACAFADEGAQLALHAYSQWEGLVDWVAQQPWSERALPVQADVTDPAAVRAAMQSARERFGRVDVCIANAGVWASEERPLWQLDEDRVRKTIEVNLLGCFWTARAFLEALEQDGPRADGHGAVLLFIGSTAGQFGEAGHADYAASKAGLVGLVRTLKNEIVALDPYARVNLIEPGWTMTEMAKEVADPDFAAKIVRTMPLRQIARAADIARTAAVLASPFASRHTSGQTITVAGGMEGRVLWEDGDVDGGAVVRRLEED